MSRLVGPVIALVTAALAIPAHGSGAQGKDQERALVQHLDTLIPLVTEARLARERSSAARDSALKASPGERLDTIDVGLLRVVTYPDQSARAREILGDVWSEWRGVVTQSPALERTIFYFTWGWRKRPALLDGPTVKEISAPAYAPRRFIEENARVAIWSVLQQGDLSATRVGRWAGPVRPPRRPEEVYRELATSPSKASRACIEGGTDACLLALGLRVPPDSLGAWYTEPERMHMALQWMEARWSRDWTYFERRFPEDAALLKRCRSDGPRGDVSACDQLLEATQAPSPLVSGRSVMAWLALETGGTGSFDRLAADSTRSPADALVAASGLPLDELADRWLAWVKDHRPEVYQDLPERRWSALFWFVVAGLMALGSTRWRFV